MAKNNKPQLIAPAGSLEKLKTALAFGADAVYLGLPEFSLRARINHFNLNKIKQGIEYAHSLDKKAYITFNIFAHNKHLKEAEKYIKKIKALKPDGIFISDPGMLTLVKKIWPQANIILSTQANCTNWQSAKFWQNKGVSRVILSRELSLKEIREVREKLPNLEIESFVHGALCMAYSGRCFLSKYLNERDANLGDCSQPCRWEYEIKPRGHDKSFVLKQNKDTSYILNSQDLCLIKKTPDMIEAGISAFKIEGRAKSIYYLANVIGAYRKAIDLYFSDIKKNKLSKDLNYLYNELEGKLFNRGYTPGFMFNKGQEAQNLDNAASKSNWEFCGQVLKQTPLKSGEYKLEVKVHNSLKTGETIEIIRPGYNILQYKLEKMTDTKSKQEVEEAHGGGGGQKVVIYTQEPVEKLSVLRRKIK